MKIKYFVIVISLFPVDMLVQRKSRNLTTEEVSEVCCSFELHDEGA
jgi:hypothetical protein